AITPKIDIKRTPISTITLNTLRKQEIEEFVSSLERIDCLQKKLRDTVEISIECLQTAAEGTDVSREELMSMLADQQREQKRMTTQLKISLIEALQCFITLTEAVIMKEDTMLEEKTAEIKKINEDKMELLDMLRHDLENT